MRAQCVSCARSQDNGQIRARGTDKVCALLGIRKVVARSWEKMRRVKIMCLQSTQKGCLLSAIRTPSKFTN